MKFVVDASILLRQVAEDPEREKVGRLLLRMGSLGSQTTPAPAFYEMGNGLRAAMDPKGRRHEERFTAVQTLLHGVRLAPPDPARARHPGMLFEKHGLTFYDAATSISPRRKAQS